MKIRVEVSSLASTNLSGVSNYTKMLCEALDKRVVLETTNFNFLKRQPNPAINMKKSSTQNTIIPLKIYAKLQSYNIAWPFDLFKSPVDLTILPNCATWPTVKSKLRATVIHDLTYIYYPEVVETKNLSHLRRVVPRSIKKADFIITVSKAIKSEIVKEFNINPAIIIVTPIPPESKYFAKNNNEIHKKYNLPTDKFIFFMGNLEPRKDLPTLIEAYIQLPDNIKKEYSLVLAGGNGWKTEKSLKALSDAQKANENIIHVGFIDADDTPAFYQQASLFVMPSIYEGFGIPILEALASKCPVIASDIPVLKETGLNSIEYAKVGNASDFSSKIKEILSNGKKRQDLIAKGSKRLQQISWDNNSQLIINKTNGLLK